MNTLIKTLRQRTYDAVFRKIHGERLIYNTCWEDPRADRELLQLDANSRIAMITSAGCNALDYLLDDPREVHCIDVNPRQNALLELKLAALATLEHDDLFALFGEGCHPQIRAIYSQHLAPCLSHASRAFWADRLHYFEGRGKRNSFYFFGAAGDVAWLVGQFLRISKPRVRTALLALLDAETLEEQRAGYAKLEPEFWGAFTRWFVRQPLTLSLLGVPRAQRDLIARQYPGGVSAYVQDKIRHLFTELTLKDNYFWRVYLTGKYTRNCCPNYLRAENLNTLRARLGRVKLHCKTFSEFLSGPGLGGEQEDSRTYTHFVLLDHQDWLAQHAPAALAQEWRLILARSSLSARVLMRSAALDIDFLPQFANSALARNDSQAEHWHERDRVGTYGRTVLATVR